MVFFSDINFYMIYFPLRFTLGSIKKMRFFFLIIWKSKNEIKLKGYQNVSYKFLIFTSRKNFQRNRMENTAVLILLLFKQTQKTHYRLILRDTFQVISFSQKHLVLLFYVPLSEVSDAQ